MTTRTRTLLAAAAALDPLLITAPTADAASGSAAGQAAGTDCPDGYVCIYPEINFGGQPWVKRAVDGSVKGLPSAIRDRGSSIRNNSGRTARVYEKRNYSRPPGPRHEKRRLHPRPARLQPQRHRPLTEDQPQRLRMTPHQRCLARQPAVLKAVRVRGKPPEVCPGGSAPVRESGAHRRTARTRLGAAIAPHRMPRLVGRPGFQQPPTARAPACHAASTARCLQSPRRCGWLSRGLPAA
ncbi:peptidase inhibitor family I36 protein [Streptomyces cellulosae]|uniref:Peptidase inhibitor family I36 protein n=1 Tax=Streptomyces cellulosae TaxID=1968 RepID=A0ABW7YIY5_STRCE